MLETISYTRPYASSRLELAARFPLAHALLLLLAINASADELPVVTVSPAGAQPSTAGSPDSFTGSARIDGRFQGAGGARVSGGTVTFEPGARTAWHTHPLGQTLIVTSGVGLVQQQGHAIQVIRPGDTVWIPPRVKHWHGATATTGMSHVAIAELKDGSAVQWLEHVSNEDYARAP